MTNAEILAKEIEEDIKRHIQENFNSPKSQQVIKIPRMTMEDVVVGLRSYQYPDRESKTMLEFSSGLSLFVSQDVNVKDFIGKKVTITIEASEVVV